MNKNIKILVVNNKQTKTTKDTLATALADLRLLNIVTVDNPRDAITEIIKDNTSKPFEVIFIHDMPNGEEMDLLKSVIEINPSNYVVMLKNNISADQVLNSIKYGASGILSSPFSPDQVRVELEKYSLLFEDSA